MTKEQINLLRALQMDDWLGFDGPVQAVNAAMRFPHRYEMSPATLNALDKIQNLYKVDIDDKALATMLKWDAKGAVLQPPEVRKAIDSAFGKYKNIISRDDILYKYSGEDFYDILIDNMVNAELLKDLARTHPNSKIVKDFISGLNSGAKYDVDKLINDSPEMLAEMIDMREMQGEIASMWLDAQGVKGIRYLDEGSRRQGAGTRNTVVFDDSIVNVLEVNGKKVTQEQRRSFFESLKNEQGSIEFPGKKKVMKAPGEVFPEEVKNIVRIQGRVIDLPPLSFNFDRIQGTEDIKKVIAATRKIFEDKIRSTVGDTVTFEEVRALGVKRLDELGEAGFKELLGKDYQKGFTELYADQMALRYVLAKGGQRLFELQQAALEGVDTGGQVLRQLALNAQIAAQDASLSAGGARLHGQRAIMAEGELAGQLKYAETSAQLLEDLPADLRGMDDRTLATMLDSYDTPGQYDALAEGLAKEKPSVFMEVWINAMLTNPPTHVVNVLSNSLFALWQIPERFVASGISKIPLLGGGVHGVRPGEAIEQLYGMTYGFRDGLRLVAKHLEATVKLKPVQMEELQKLHFHDLNKLEMLREPALTAERYMKELEFFGLGDSFVASGVDRLGEVVRTPGKLLLAGDDLFKMTGYRMELQAQALRRASLEFDSGVLLKTYKADLEAMQGTIDPDRIRSILIAKRKEDIIKAPPARIRSKAIQAAHYNTFTDELGEMGQAVQSGLKAWPVLRLWVPFLKVPIKLTERTIERSPVKAILAPFMKSMRADLMKRGAERDIALSRIFLGSMIAWTSYQWAADGRITGDAPKNPAARELFYRQGKQPFSYVWDVDSKYEAIAISLAEGGGISYDKRERKLYVQYNRLDPFGMLIGAAASMYSMSGSASDVDNETMASDLTWAIISNLTSKTWLQGVANIEDALRYEDFTVAIQRLGGSIVPAGVNGLRRLVDPAKRDTRTPDPMPFGMEPTPALQALERTVREVQSRTPGWSENVPIDHTLWGDPILYEGALGPDIASPFYKSTRKHTPVDDEMLRHEAFVSEPARNIKGIPLSPLQYQSYVILAGKMAKEKLDTKIYDPKYLNQSDGPEGGKASVLRSTILGTRKAAGDIMIATDPDLKRKFDAMELQKQINLMPKSKMRAIEGLTGGVTLPQ